MRQLIRAPIEFPISQSLLAEHQSDGVGRSLDLLLNDLMQALVYWIGLLGVVPLDEHLVPAGLGNGIIARCAHL
ncbi:MAG: hypothetical protein ACKVP2_06450 [Burkholderiales bacterium]